MFLLDGIQVDFEMFPNNELILNFNKLKFCDTSNITWIFSDNSDFFKLYILKSYMDSIFQNNKFTLIVPYFPYSRMDRDNAYYVFSLKYVCSFINNMNFFKVTSFDVHSDVTAALINRFNKKSNINILFNVFYKEYGSMDNCIIVYPDVTAEKRYGHIFTGYSSLTAMKSRNFKTGEINKYILVGEYQVFDKDILFIDDLCSGGKTFLEAAKALKTMGAKDIYLIVGHCEMNIVNGDILKTDIIKKVYTTNSINPPVNDKIYIMDILKENKNEK